MENIVLECSIHILLLSYINCYNIIGNSNRNDVFTQKELYSNYETSRYTRKNLYADLVFVRNPSKRFLRQPQRYKKKNQITPSVARYIIPNTIENDLKTQRVDAIKKTNKTVQVSKVQLQWSVLAKRAFDYNEYFTFSKKNTRNTIATTEETEYFLAMPTITFQKPSFLPTQMVETVKVKSFETLFESTTKNYFYNFVKNHFPCTTLSWNYTNIFSKITEKTQLNWDARNLTIAPFHTKSDQTEINEILNNLKNDTAIIHSFSQPMIDNELQKDIPLYTLPIDLNTRNLTLAPSRQTIDDININRILKYLRNDLAFTNSPSQPINNNHLQNHDSLFGLLEYYYNNSLVQNIARTSKKTEPISKCYSCGWYEKGIPQTSCYSIFGGGEEPIFKDGGKSIFFKTHCFKSNENKTTTADSIGKTLKEHWEKNHLQKSPNFIGGCFKRYTDVGAHTYYELGCRAWPPVSGFTFASRRFSRVERTLRGRTEGCAVSPHASLTPFSRGVYLWVRYHVCICQGRYCNAQPLLEPTFSCFVFILLFYVKYLLAV